MNYLITTGTFNGKKETLMTMYVLTHQQRLRNMMTQMRSVNEKVFGEKQEMINGIILKKIQTLFFNGMALITQLNSQDLTGRLNFQLLPQISLRSSQDATSGLIMLETISMTLTTLNQSLNSKTIDACSSTLNDSNGVMRKNLSGIFLWMMTIGKDRTQLLSLVIR